VKVYGASHGARVPSSSSVFLVTIPFFPSSSSLRTLRSFFYWMRAGGIGGVSYGSAQW